MATLNMNISENIQRIKDAKASIKTAIEAKGVAIPADALIDTYAARVNEIQAGGASLDLTGTGWETEPSFPISTSRLNTLEEDLDYTRTKYAEWTPGGTSLIYKYKNDQNLIYAPKIDTSAVTNMSYCFNGCSNLSSIPALDTSAVTNMSYCFYDCLNLISIPALDTSKVTDMRGCFNGCSNLSSIPEWDTSKVTNISWCFAHSPNLTSIPQLDTSAVTDMSYCFAHSPNLTSIPQLDTSKVTDMGGCFQDCSSLTSIPLLDTSAVTNMRHCFSSCKNLISVELTGGMLSNCDCQYAISGVSAYGTLKIHTGGSITRASYNPIINVLPSTWTVQEIND